MKWRRLATVGLVAVLVIVLGGCTVTKTGLESGEQDEVLQPQAVGVNAIETIDELFARIARQVPGSGFGGAFFNEGCPAGRTCRWSDSAFIRLASGVQANLGYIAKPAGIGSITIVGNYQVLGTFTHSAQGQIVYKVGKRTGLTRGSVDRTCWDYIPPSGVILLCQRTVVGETPEPALPGDSGSPVFHIDSGDLVWLHGMVWGGVPWEFFFSGIGQIQNDLGRLITCTTGLC